MHLITYLYFGLLVLPNLAAPPDHDTALNTEHDYLPNDSDDPPEDLATDMDNVNSGDDLATDMDNANSGDNLDDEIDCKCSCYSSFLNHLGSHPR